MGAKATGLRGTTRARSDGPAYPRGSPGAPHRLERHARARRWLGEDHRHRLARERLEGLVTGIELLLRHLRLVQHVLQLVLAEVVEVQEVLALARGRDVLAAPELRLRGRDDRQASADGRPHGGDRVPPPSGEALGDLAP